MTETSALNRRVPLSTTLAVTFLGSVSSGVFWSAIFFITAAHYQFSPTRNLVLAALIGAAYATGARNAGRLTRGLFGGRQPRAVVWGALFTWTAIAFAPLARPDSEAILWAVTIVGGAVSGTLWPVVESYLTAGRHGRDMRVAIGWFNVMWTSAVALSLLLMPIVGGRNGLGALWLSAGTSASALVIAFALPKRPGEHARDNGSASVGAEYPLLLRAATWLLPMSYVLSSTMAPILPHRLAEVAHETAGLGTGPIGSLWLVARFVTLLVMWRTEFWHGRWGTLVAAGTALAGGLAVILFSRTVVGLGAGLLIFGTGMGVTYYSALYYSMAVGRGAVEAGATFESLIGLGYVVGPLLGIFPRAAKLPVSHLTVTVALAWLVVAVGGSLSIRPYLQARRARAAERPR